MSPPAIETTHLGFLSILREPAGYVGGYLVTNSWGRPLEFRVSSAVQPNRVQQILYGESLDAYLCGELIGKTLIDKTPTPVQAVFTDHAAALHVRPRLTMPVALVTPDEGRLGCHQRFPTDHGAVAALLERLGGFDLAEPFSRIREAIAEARKLGIGGRGLAA